MFLRRQTLERITADDIFIERMKIILRRLVESVQGYLCLLFFCLFVLYCLICIHTGRPNANKKKIQEMRSRGKCLGNEAKEKHEQQKNKNNKMNGAENKCCFYKNKSNVVADSDKTTCGSSHSKGLLNLYR